MITWQKVVLVATLLAGATVLVHFGAADLAGQAMGAFVGLFQ